MEKVENIAYLLAGGKGARLMPLTEKRAKPAVPFGGLYRIVDFALSNCVNSGLKRIVVATQSNARSLEDHIHDGWQFMPGLARPEFIRLAPPTADLEGSRYSGTADAVYQNIRFIEQFDPAVVNVLAGDHIYFLNFGDVNRFHLSQQADLTVVVKRVPRTLAANQYGVFEIDNSGKVLGFSEKPSNPCPIQGDTENCLASLGVYSFRPDVMLDFLRRDSLDTHSGHDFGKNVIPAMVREKRRVFVFDLEESSIPGIPRANKGYWRDVGTLGQYYQACMDLLGPNPSIILNNRDWPIHAYVKTHQPTRIFQSNGKRVDNSILGMGVIIDNASVAGSIVSEECVIGPDSSIDGAILLGDVRVGKGSQIFHCIVDKHVNIPPRSIIGKDLAQDEARGFTVYRGPEGHFSVVPRGYRFSK